MKQIITRNRFTNLRSLRKSRTISKPSCCGSSSVGATLTEILMALMVMGIGLVSVASLFPISMLRSIQATKLTNAVLLKFQCEEYLQALPNLSKNNYDVAYPTVNNLLGNVEFTNRSVIWGRHAVANVGELKNILPINVVSVIDPIGASFNTGADAKSYGKDFYGLHTATPLYYTTDRKNSGFNFLTQKNLAFSMFSSNDSWKQFLSSIEVTGGGAGVTTVTLVDVAIDDMAEFNSAITSGSLARIILVDSSGKQSHVSAVSSVAGNVVTFASPLPDNGLYTAISEVRLELFESRYTCLITLRKQLVSLGANGQPGGLGDDDGANGAEDLGEVAWPGSDDIVRVLGGDLVVFFRRDFSPLAEQVYGVENLNKGQVGIQPQEVRIRWASGGDTKPRIRQGGYVFDSRNGYWYQIRTIIEEDQPATNLNGVPWIDNTNDREAVIMLDRSPEATGQFLMVPENVVEVFDFNAF